MTMGAGITALIRTVCGLCCTDVILRAGCRLGMIFHAGMSPLTRRSVVCAVRMKVLRAGCRLGMILHAGITPLTRRSVVCAYSGHCHANIFPSTGHSSPPKS